MIKDHTGKVSMMRVGFMTSCILSIIMGIGGTIAVFYKLPDAQSLILGASSLLSASAFAKGIQSKYENTP